jgi:hypothetical protein
MKGSTKLVIQLQCWNCLLKAASRLKSNSKLHQTASYGKLGRLCRKYAILQVHKLFIRFPPFFALVFLSRLTKKWTEEKLTAKTKVGPDFQL